MPLLNGYEAARAIRSAPLPQQPFLVALTAAHGVAIEVATRAVGFDFYLRKPAEPTRCWRSWRLVDAHAAGVLNATCANAR